MRILLVGRAQREPGWAGKKFVSQHGRESVYMCPTNKNANNTRKRNEQRQARRTRTEVRMQRKSKSRSRQQTGRACRGSVRRVGGKPTRPPHRSEWGGDGLVIPRLSNGLSYRCDAALYVCSATTIAPASFKIWVSCRPRPPLPYSASPRSVSRGRAAVPADLSPPVCSGGWKRGISPPHLCLGGLAPPEAVAPRSIVSRLGRLWAE